ncbi:MAG: aspartate carbamoyltransferase regulatory subunit [Bacteroidetes bacterium]|nr:aspartate carbamoyltransferase regulatory subunit [Bacteroidota bacterium]
MKEKTEKRVSAIKDGSVIDHIPAKTLFKVVSILALETIETPITVGTNLKSNKLGSKGIIKISDKFFKEEEINKIALIAPEARLNIIRNYEVVEKKVLVVPDKIEGIAKCFNPKCITNVENVMTRFSVISKDKVALKCRYCEKITSREHLVII